MNLELRNFFVSCICGHDARIDFLDQERICVCGRRLSISPSARAYLIAQQEESLERRASETKATGEGHILASIRDGASSMIIRLQDSADDKPRTRRITIGGRTYALTVEGDLFHHDDLSEAFLDALESFKNNHASALWDQQ